ncbi:uncharacterized protein IAS62_005092 [Cryptococcus decagattii]|uniref:Uncharacterized protein n=1 Tax=Cryptococcus decagattii TaxID=1859122 RepID=A0ABZ2B275_9TREE
MPHLSKKHHLFRRPIQYLLSLRRKYETPLLPSTDDKMIKTLRMNYAKFRSLVALFGDHTIFRSKGRKPQAPEVQLATCFYRMAGGEREGTVENHFNLSHGSVSNYTDRSLIAIASFLKEYISWPTGAERAVLARKLYAQYGLPSCVGFIDGADIHQTPSIGGEKALKLIAVVDHLKRFRYWMGLAFARSEVMSIGGGVTETGEEPQNDRRDEIVMEVIKDKVRRDPAFDVDTFQM